MADKPKSGRKSPKDKPIGYICGAAILDLHWGAPSAKIYSTLKALKKDNKCWKECGIVAFYEGRVLVNGEVFYRGKK